MGICRGHQLIAVIDGGNFYQDRAHDAGTEHAPIQMHRVRLHPRSRLGQVVGCMATVNPFYHQTVRDVLPGWDVVAESFDAVIEAIEHPTLPVISVQWHPEALGDAVSDRLFAHFLSLHQ